MSVMTLDEMPAEHDPCHMLLIADTKHGKSTYVAQAAIDGHYLLYIDSDNGISALRHAIEQAGKPEALKRIAYIKTASPSVLLKDLMESGIFRWNLTQDKKFSSGLAAPTDKMIEIIPSKIPHNIILVNDSWTTTAIDALQDGAVHSKTDLEKMKDDNKSQEVYGGANIRLTLLCAIIQQVKFNVIVLAHPTTYEKYSKPTGRVGDVKQKDMILLDTKEVPLSSSRPHGETMGKYFTDIGWIDIDRMGKRILSFEVEFKRISGGRPNKRGEISTMSFTNLFSKPPTEPLFDDSWIRSMTTAEWKEKNSGAATQAVAKPAGVKPDGTLSSTPAKPVATSMLLKK